MVQHKIQRGVDKARQAAVAVLRHNAHGPFDGLPRTAETGYPEPYTRDLLLSLFGIAVSNDSELLQSLRRVLETLAGHQTLRGHIPSLVHDPGDRGASDTTPLFLLAISIYRSVTGERLFLEEAARRAFQWIDFQSPTDRVLVGQQPTSDWRDEQWVLGHGLYVNALVYACRRLFGRHDEADRMRDEMAVFDITGQKDQDHVHRRLSLPHKPYYALWSFKVLRSERFDLLGNSLAILFGIASRERALQIIQWIEDECRCMKRTGALGMDLPPNFFPFVLPADPDWHPRDETFNQPGNYHNGGIWPFVSGLYVAALVAAEAQSLAEKKLVVLTETVRKSRFGKPDFGFNEWLRARDGMPMGQDGQTWSAAMYLYAAQCVAAQGTPLFDEMRMR
jgi:hypothetical protein